LPENDPVPRHVTRAGKRKIFIVQQRCGILKAAGKEISRPYLHGGFTGILLWGMIQGFTIFMVITMTLSEMVIAFTTVKQFLRIGVDFLEGAQKGLPTPRRARELTCRFSLDPAAGNVAGPSLSQYNSQPGPHEGSGLAGDSRNGLSIFWGGARG
jgi:hypothetical protein